MDIKNYKFNFSGIKSWEHLTYLENLGKKPPGIKALSNRLMLDERRVDECLKRLEDGDIVHQVVNQRINFSPGFIPAVAPADLKASSVFSVITGWNGQGEHADTNDAFTLIRNGLEKSLENRSVRSFLIDEENNLNG